MRWSKLYQTIFSAKIGRESVMTFFVNCFNVELFRYCDTFSFIFPFDHFIFWSFDWIGL